MHDGEGGLECTFYSCLKPTAFLLSAWNIHTFNGDRS